MEQIVGYDYWFSKGVDKPITISHTLDYDYKLMKGDEQYDTFAVCNVLKSINIAVNAIKNIHITPHNDVLKTLIKLVKNQDKYDILKAIQMVFTPDIDVFDIVKIEQEYSRSTAKSADTSNYSDMGIKVEYKEQYNTDKSNMDVKDSTSLEKLKELRMKIYKISENKYDECYSKAVLFVFRWCKPKDGLSPISKYNDISECLRVLWDMAGLHEFINLVDISDKFFSLDLSYYMMNNLIIR